MEITSDCVDGLSGTGYKTGYISPLRARTMKEYEQQISDLQKENFNLKLRLYFLEEKMEKNFDCDTRQLHEINIQLKIEGETMRKDLEQKEKLLQEARTNLQKVEEMYQKEIHEWIENFKKESNTLKDEDGQKEDVFQENLNVESEESMSELYKQAFGSDICSQAQTDTSESSHDSDRENRLEESMNTLQKLDKLHKEELSDLRATTREKQSSLENYVAKLKQQHIEQKQTESDSKDSNTSTISEKENIKNLSDTFNSKIVKSLFSTEEMCENCKINANRILEKKLDIMKKQSLKRDKTIQGLTEILYRKEKDLKYLRVKLDEKEAADQILKLFKQSINNSIIKAEVDQTVTDKLFLILKKYLCTYQKKEDSQISESNIELFEKYFLQWLTSIQNNCASKEESSVEESTDDIKKELDSLHQAVKDKNLFIQELLTERKTSTTENTKSMQNLLNNLKQKDVLIQDLKSKLEEFEKHANKENAIIKESIDLSQSKIEITKLNNIKDRLLNDNEILKINHNKLKEGYEDILKQKNAEIQKFTEVSKKLQCQIRGLEQQIDEKVQIILKYEKEKNDLKEQEEKTNASSYEKQLELMREKLECTRLELENSKLNNNHLQTKIIEKDRQFEMINRNYNELQSEYEKIQNILIEKDTLFCELKDKLLEMTEEFNKIKKIKKFESEELERLRNKERISVSTKEKEIQELKSLLQEKTLLAEALNVELQLRENVAEQLHEGLYTKPINNHDHKITSTNNYSLNKFVSKLKRYSLPVYLETEKQYSKYLTQNLSNFGKSNDIYQLKEEICFLVLKIENLEHQIQEYNGDIGRRYSMVSGVSCVFPNSLNRTTKTLNILHSHVEELANFLECLLRFDSDGQLDISLLTPNNVAKLKKYLADSKELSQSLSVSLWGEELSVVDNTLDLEPSKDVGRIKDSDEVEKIADEKTENLKNQMAECHAALQNKVLECDTLVQTKEMLEKKLLECQQELVLCREMLEKLKIQLEDKERDYQKLLMAKDHLEVKDNENCALHKEVHRKLVGLSNLVENMQKRLSEEEKKVNIISLEKSELEQEINKKNQEIQEVQQLNFQLQNELKEKEIACKIFEDKFQNEIEAKKIISNNFEERLESEMRERKVMCKNFEEKLEKEIQERQLICQNYEEKLQNELKEKNLIFQDYQEIKTLLSSLQQNCIQLKSELEARIISEKNLLKEKTLLERDICCKEEQLKDLAESLKNCEKELERKQSDWETKENENFICIKALQDERNGLNEKLQNTEKELLEIQNLHLDLKTQIQEFNMKLKNNKKEEFVKEMQYLRKELKRSLHSNKKLCDKMEKLQSYEQTVRVSNESDIPDRLTVSYFKRASQLSTEILKDCTNISQKHKTKWRSCDNLSKGTDCSYIANYLPAAKELKLIKNIEDSADQFHYTSPDQGIDSDPSQDLKIHKISDLNQKQIIEKELNATENLNLALHSKNQVLYAVCQLQDYELLKKEIEESLVLIKGIRARIKERLGTFSSKSSPGKSLEYSTLKEINSSSANLEAYLEECWHLIGLIWITTVPQITTENTNNNDTPIKISLLDELAIAKRQIIELTKELTEAKDKINANQRRKEKMERAINTQLLKTRNVLKEAKGNLEKKLPENPSNKTQLCK